MFSGRGDWASHVLKTDGTLDLQRQRPGHKPHTMHTKAPRAAQQKITVPPWARLRRCRYHAQCISKVALTSSEVRAVQEGAAPAFCGIERRAVGGGHYFGKASAQHADLNSDQQGQRQLSLQHAEHKPNMGLNRQQQAPRRSDTRVSSSISQTARAFVFSRHLNSHHTVVQCRKEVDDNTTRPNEGRP